MAKNGLPLYSDANNGSGQATAPFAGHPEITNSPESLKNSLCSFQFPQPPHRGKTLSEQIAEISVAICFCRQTRPRRQLYPMHDAAKEAHTLGISKI